MAGRPGAPVRVRRVSSELRELRLRSGLGAEEVAQALGFSMSKLSRIENGQRSLYADDVSALLGLYRVPAQRREELLAMVRNGHDRNWWQVHDRRLPARWQDFMRFEADATVIYNWEPQFIPGLLQTDEYAERIIRGTTYGLPEAEIHRLVAARLGRRSLLAGNDAPELHVLLDEMILRRPVGEQGVLERQLEHLVRASCRSNVIIQVVPFAAGVHPGMEGALVLLEFPKHPSLVFQEYGSNNVFLEEAEHVAVTKLAIRRLRELALSPDDSVDLIARLAGELPSEQ